MSGKLIYYYGTVCSSKTMNLLSIAHNYDECGWNVVILKPSLDTRSTLIETRAKMPPRKADVILEVNDSVFDYNPILMNADVVMVDECQFLTETQIQDLREFATSREIDVLCFGLKTDYNNRLFRASKRLLELADELNEVKTICYLCGKHASFNKKVEGIKDDSSVIDVGWDTYKPVCYRHYIDGL